MPWSHRQTLVPLGLVVAVALGVALHAHLARGPAAAGLLEQPRQNTAQLYQIGDQEFLAMNSGSNEDLAASIEKILTKEKILLKQVAKRADKHARVEINIKAGQIGKRGPPGPPGYQGPKGFQGPRGHRGPRGNQGPRGVTGPIGIKGIKGTDGIQGPHGLTGDQGPPGPPGPRGRRGREGRRGDEGALGKNGANGAPGDMGIMGNPGPPAWEGSRGKQGPPGPPGPTGYNGAPGISGDMGERGPKGNNGARGAPGDRGPPGEPGKSQCGLATTTGKQMCCGEVDADKWTYAGANTIYIDVDTSKCRFDGQPYYFTTLYADGMHYHVYTMQNIVNPDKTPNEMHPRKFRVYLRNGLNDNELTLNMVKARHASLKWCGFGTSDKPAPSYAMCCGASRTKNFHDSGGNTYVDVNTAGCGWTDNQDAARMKQPAPWYFTTLKDTSNGKSAGIRSPSVYSPGQQGFRSYLDELPGQDANSATRYNNENIDVQWCAVKPMAGATNGGAGYPCTSPRVLVGAGDQAVQTNHAKICCRKTGSDGWKDAGKGVFLYKEIDISPCDMKKVHVTMVDVRGDEGSIDFTGGGKSFSVGSDAKLMKVSIWTRGKYKFYDAERYHWKAQYCLVGE